MSMVILFYACLKSEERLKVGNQELSSAPEKAYSSALNIVQNEVGLNLGIMPLDEVVNAEGILLQIMVLDRDRQAGAGNAPMGSRVPLIIPCNELPLFGNRMGIQ